MTKSDFIKSIRQFIADGKTEEALELLCEKINEFQPDLLNDTTLLKSRFHNVKNDSIIKGIVPQEDYIRTTAQVNYAILEILEQLEKSTIVTTQGAKDKSKGRILHNIPGTMPINKETRCIVRIAYDDVTLMRDFEATADTLVESVRIAEVMGVELLDFNDIPAFQIRTVNEEEQFVASDDYTQWIFKVKPLIEGVFPLTLKVSVIEEIDGKERKRDIVLEKEVFIISQVEVPSVTSQKTTTNNIVAFEDTTYRLNYVVNDDKGAVTATSLPTKKRSTTAIVSALATIIFAITGLVVYQNRVSEKQGNVVLHEKGDTTTHKGGKILNDIQKEPDNPLAVVDSGHLAPRDSVVNDNSKRLEIKKVPIKPQPRIMANVPPSDDKQVKTKPKKNRPIIIEKDKKLDANIPFEPQDVSDTTGFRDEPQATQPKKEVTNEGELKTYRVRIKLKDEMKNAEILVNGHKPLRVKNNIWGTPQYVEFQSREKLQKLTFIKDGISCTVDNIDTSKGEVEVEACSFKKKKTPKE